MKIHSVKCRNFKSIGGKWQNFEISDSGMTLIRGDNGEGKSTIISAIQFALFGKSTDMKNNGSTPVPNSELINDVNKKELEVEILLSNGYTIKRGLKPDYFNILDSKGVDLADKSSKVIDQKFLENEILGGMNLSMFHKISYISSKAVSKPFLFMSSSEKKEFIENLLDIRILYFINEVTKKKISESKLSIRTLEEILNTHRLNVRVEEENIKNLNEERLKKLKRLEEIKNSKEKMIQEANDKISKAKGKIIELEQKNSYILLDIEQIKSEQKSLLSVIDPSSLITERDVMLSEIQNIQKSMIQQKAGKDAWEKNKENFVMCGDCPTVSKIIGNFDIEKYRDFIELKKSKLIEINVYVKKLEKDIDYRNVSKKQYEALELEMRSFESDVDRNNREVEFQKSEIASQERVIKGLSKDLSEMKLDKPSENHLQKLKLLLDEKEEEFDMKVRYLEKLERVKKRTSDKSVKQELLSYYIPIFTQKVNEILSVFMEDDTFDFRIELDENFDIEGYKNGRKSNIFKLSTGQLSSINFALMLGFQYLLELKNSYNFDFFFVDEVLDSSGLSIGRLDKVIKYLQEISKTKPVLVVTHNPSIQQEYFDKFWSVERVGVFSQYNFK